MANNNTDWKIHFFWKMFDTHTYGLLDDVIDDVAYQCGMKDFNHEHVPNEQYASWYNVLWSPIDKQESELFDNLHRNSHILADEYVLPYFENLKKSSNN